MKNFGLDQNSGDKVIGCIDVTVQCYTLSVHPEPVEGLVSFDRLRTNGDIFGNPEQLRIDSRYVPTYN